MAKYFIIGAVLLGASISTTLLARNRPMPLPVGPLPGASLDSFEEGTAQSFIGHSKGEIVNQLGSPTRTRDGYYGNPSPEFRRIYRGTQYAVYERPTGQLYLCFCQLQGRWVCVCADWLPAGAVF